METKWKFLIAWFPAMVITLFILLIYAVFVYWRFVAMRFQTNPEGIEEPPPPNTSRGGLSPRVIASIPTIAYTKKKNDGGEDDVECVVCVGVIANNENVRVLPDCKHMFHAECIGTWLASHSTCPICRAMVQPSAP